MVTREQLKAFQVRNSPGFVFVVRAEVVCKCGDLRPCEILLGTGRSGPLAKGARSAIRRVEVGTLAACPTCGGPSK